MLCGDGKAHSPWYLQKQFASYLHLYYVPYNFLFRYVEFHSGNSASGCSTAIGFDERMLLHSEVCLFFIVS